jgi:NAD(P)-dependent dehydrogenase (short-subunit alcohol dehydrogenase family)
MMNMSAKAKVAIVTGGGKRIGLAPARPLPLPEPA